VLDFLAERTTCAKEFARSDAGGKALLAGMVRKKWIGREDVSAARDAARLVKVAVLRGAEERAEASPPLDERVARPTRSSTRTSAR